MWTPAVNVAWQILLLNPLQISPGSPPTTDVPVYDIDLFDNTPATIASLKSLGKNVICYFSAGTYEPGRSDAHEFLPADLGSGLPDWPGEQWLDVKSSNVRSIMSQRIALAKSKGCDAIDPDNVDAFDNANGLGLTIDDSIAYVHFLASEAAKLDLSIGLKNAGSIVLSVLDVVHFAVNEQCAQFNECDHFAPFIAQNKPVFHIEYPSGAPAVDAGAKTVCCAPQSGAQFSTVLKKLGLDEWVEYCDGVTGTPSSNLANAGSSSAPDSPSSVSSPTLEGAVPYVSSPTPVVHGISQNAGSHASSPTPSPYIQAPTDDSPTANSDSPAPILDILTPNPAYSSPAPVAHFTYAAAVDPASYSSSPTPTDDVSASPDTATPCVETPTPTSSSSSRRHRYRTHTSTSSPDSSDD